MIINNTVWRIAGISGLFAMSILAGDLPSSDTTDNSQAQNPDEVSLKLQAFSLIDEQSEKSKPSQAASGLSPAPKKRNEEKPQPKLENEVGSEPFAEPTPISQTMSSSLIDKESEKSEHRQPASGLSPAPKKRNEEKPQPSRENEVGLEPFAEPTPISQKMSGWLIDEESEKSESPQPAS